MTFAIDIDTLYPRDAEHRYRLYARRGNELEVLAVTGEAGGIGQAIVQLDADEREHGRRLMDRGALGILDAVESRWLVLPWHRPERKVTVGALPLELAPEHWTGKVVRSRGSSRLWRVGPRGPFGFHLTPVDPPQIPRISRTAAQLAKSWEVVTTEGDEDAPAV